MNVDNYEAMEDRQQQHGVGGDEASSTPPSFRRVGSRSRSRSFNNSTTTSSSPSRKEDGGPRARAACGATKKAYSLESIQRCRRWRPCQLLREVFAKTPLLFGARRQPSKATTAKLMTPAESATLSSEDSGHADSPVSLVSVVIESPPSPPPACGQPRSRRSCSADSAVDFDSNDDATAPPSGGSGGGGGTNGSVVMPAASADDHCSVAVVHCEDNSLHQPQHPAHQLHRTSLPGERGKRTLSQCLSLSCPVLTAPCVIVSDFSSCDVSPDIIEEVDVTDLSNHSFGGGEARDYLSLGGRSCSSCSLSSTVSSASWDDEASQSDVSEAGSSSSKVSAAWRLKTTGRGASVGNPVSCQPLAD